MRKPHWMFIDSARSFGGHEVMLLRWLQEVRTQARVIPVLIARADTRLYEQAPQGVLAMPLSGRRLSRHDLSRENPRSTARYIPRFAKDIVIRMVSGCIDIYRLARYVLRLQPELVIIAEGTVLAEAWVTFLLRVLGVKTVIYVPLTQSGKEMGFGRGALRDWLVRRIYRHLPYAWITLSREQAQHFSGWSRVNRPVFILPNTVTSEIEHAAETGVANNIQRSLPESIHQPLRVLILGRLDAHQKSLDTLLDYLCFHVGLSTEFHFTFVGDGPFGPQIEQRLSMFPALQKLVSLRKWSATLDVMREHDVLLLASRYEGVPLVMLEAMALGMPVIATDLPGTRALLSADCLFTTGDYDAAVQLLNSIRKEEKRVAMIQRNREMFLATASGVAFARAVDVLTGKLIRLASSTPDADIQSDDVTVIST